MARVATPRGIAITIPLHTVSEANTQRSKWREKNRRVADHRSTVTAVLQAEARGHLKLPIVVRLTRIAPRELDPGDNLPSALKATRDAIATLLCPVVKRNGTVDGNDRDPRITWRYGQEKGAYSVRIELHPRENGPASDLELIEDALALQERLAKVGISMGGTIEALRLNTRAEGTSK